MKMQNLTEIWILNDVGKVFFHYPQLISSENSGLLNQFLSGISKFMKDMGGNKEYLLSMGSKRIIGLELKDIPSQFQPLYIVGAFVGRNKKDLKYINILSEGMCQFITKHPHLERSHAAFVKWITQYL